MARRDLPSLDLLAGFEAAARHLSFTKAAAELFLTQSAISRQVQTLEEQLGTPLFQRRHRALVLTEAGHLLYGSASDTLRLLEDTTQRIRGLDGGGKLSVTTSMSFASLWLIPRLPRFREQQPQVDVRISADNTIIDLNRERIDVAIRYCAAERAPPHAVRLFGEAVAPICSPALLQDRKRPLRSVADLRHHTLLHDDDTRYATWLEWPTWLRTHGAPNLRPASELYFSIYDQMIDAAVDGQGIALGRPPLLSHLIERGRLVMPLSPQGAEPVMSTHAFFVIAGPAAKGKPEVEAFVQWLQAEAGTQPAATAQRSAKKPQR